MFTREAQHSLQRGSKNLICTVDEKNQKLLPLVFGDSDCIWFTVTEGKERTLMKKPIFTLHLLLFIYLFLYLKVKMFKGAICWNLKVRQEIWGRGLITKVNYCIVLNFSELSKAVYIYIYFIFFNKCI